MDNHTKWYSRGQLNSNLSATSDTTPTFIIITTLAGYQGKHTPFDAVDDGFENVSSVSCNEEADGIIL